MYKILEKLRGRKTYLLAAVTVLYAVSGLILGQIEQEKAIELILGALTVSALRNGMPNS